MVKAVESRNLNTVVNRSLIQMGAISSEFLDILLNVLIQDRQELRTMPEMIAHARQWLARYEIELAELLTDAELGAWIAGMNDLARDLPPLVVEEFASGIRPGRRTPPVSPPRLPRLIGTGDIEPRLELPLIKRAAESLLERSILTRNDFDQVGAIIQADAFTIAGRLKEDTIERIRGVFVETINQGASLDRFAKAVEDSLGTSPLAPGHLENVYRTNLQGAFRDGRETLAANPVVAATFPYQAYNAIRDTRVREEHLALETLGLNGTNIYRADDPMWQFFTPPWDYNCRCNVIRLTVTRAASAGVKEAQQWLETGRPPLQPEFRLAFIPFEPHPGFGDRGRIGVFI